MDSSYTLELADETATLEFGAKISTLVKAPIYIYLAGDLGAGKTTFTRGFLNGLGFQGRVKSPTYTLIESYQIQSLTLYHLDLYRLSDPEELEFMGLRDLIDTDSIFIIEWPEKGQGWLPSPDVILTLEYAGQGRRAKLDYKASKLLGNPDK